MTTRIYLDQEAKTAVLENAGNANFLRDIAVIRFRGINLEARNEELYFEINPRLDVVPELVKSHVERVTLCETFHGIERRESGIYEIDFAQAELTLVGTEPLTYHVEINGKNLESVEKLLRLIKVGGGIRPTMSYEAPQGGLSRTELEKELGTAKKTITSLENTLNFAKQKEKIKKFHLQNVIDSVEVLKTELKDQFLPFVSSKSMIGKLQTIINFSYNPVKEMVKKAAETEDV